MVVMPEEAWRVHGRMSPSSSVLFIFRFQEKNRTTDLQISRLALYHLSYPGSIAGKGLLNLSRKAMLGIWRSVRIFVLMSEIVILQGINYKFIPIYQFFYWSILRCLEI